MLDLLSIGTNRGHSMIGVGISAGLTGAKRARSIQDPLPALDLDWATDRSLPAAYGPTPSFSRASTGTYFNSSGVLTSADINAPRFDHTFNGTSWVSRGLLVEEQRTSLCLRSQEFDNAYWQKFRWTVSANSAVAPDGTATADTHTQIAGQTISGASSTGNFSFSAIAYTFSIYAKRISKDYIQIVERVTGDGRGTFFNISSGTIGTISAGHTASIINCGNGWYRCTITFTGAAVTNDISIYHCDNDSTVTVTDSGSTIFWGAQLETGSFPTSYIPTTTAAVTRSADVCQITGTDFSGFWNASEGSFALNYDCPANGTLVQYQANSAASTNIHTAVSIGTTQYFQVYLPPEQALLNAGSIVANLPQGLSSAYKLNDFAASLNGGAVATDTAGSLPTPTKIIIGADGSSYINGHISRLRYYPTRLANAKLQELST